MTPLSSYQESSPAAGCEGGAHGLGRGPDRSPAEFWLEFVPLDPAKAWNGLDPNCSWAAFNIGSWMSRYMRWSALWPPENKEKISSRVLCSIDFLMLSDERRETSTTKAMHYGKAFVLWKTGKLMTKSRIFRYIFDSLSKVGRRSSKVSKISV